MSERNIPEEQPPEEGPALREWLSRMMILINGALDNTDIIKTFQKLPNYIIDGMFAYFPQPILPDITHEGPWTIIEGEWRPVIGMNYQGAWEQGKKYMAQDVVFHEGWTMASLINNNFDIPSPQETGPNELFPVGNPGFSIDTYTGTVSSGMSYTFSTGGYLTDLEVYIPELGANIQYAAIISNVTEPDNPRAEYLPLGNLVVGWNTVAIAREVVPNGSILEIYLEAINSGASTTWQYPWLFEGDQPNAGPPLGYWNKTNNNDILRINKEDGDGIDHNLELQVVQNTEFLITQLDNPDKFIELRVVGAYIDQGTYYEYPVIQLSVGADGEPDPGVGTQVRALQPVADPTEYVTIAGYLSTNQPSFAAATSLLHFDGTPQIGLNNALHGVRIGFTPADTSDTWGYVAYASEANTASRVAVEEMINASTVTSVDIITGKSFDKQYPAFPLNPLKLTFGPALGSIADPVQILADGTVQVNETGYYDISIYMNCTRDDNNQVAKIMLNSTINGTLVDSAVAVTIDKSTDNNPFTFATVHPMNAGDILETYVTQIGVVADGGIDSIQFGIPVIPDVPSVWLRITKREVVA